MTTIHVIQDGGQFIGRYNSGKGNIAFDLTYGQVRDWDMQAAQAAREAFEADMARALGPCNFLYDEP
jgi:hypothetical protein